MRPLIAVSPLYNEKRNLQLMPSNYLEAIELAGGAPVVLPLTRNTAVLEAVLSQCSGILFTGGHDIDPVLYGQEMLSQCGELSPLRDMMEGWMLDWALEREIPILAICRGMQLLNVHLGGTLYQDLPTQRKKVFNHSQEPPYEAASHTVLVAKDSFLSQFTGWGPLQVNSLHHQAVDRVAPGMIVEACSIDGVVESIRLPDKPFVLGIQWHPEYNAGQQKVSAEIFKGFLNACKEKQNGKNSR